MASENIHPDTSADLQHALEVAAVSLVGEAIKTTFRKLSVVNDFFKRPIPLADGGGAGRQDYSTRTKLMLWYETRRQLNLALEWYSNEIKDIVSTCVPEAKAAVERAALSGLDRLEDKKAIVLGRLSSETIGESYYGGIKVARPVIESLKRCSEARLRRAVGDELAHIVDDFLSSA